MAKLACYRCHQPAAALGAVTLTGYGPDAAGVPRLVCPWCVQALVGAGLERLEQERWDGVVVMAGRET